MMSAKLLVFSGAFDQASGGETFSPGQEGLVRLGSAPAYFAGQTSLSLKAGDVSVKGSAAAAKASIVIARLRIMGLMRVLRKADPF